MSEALGQGGGEPDVSVVIPTVGRPQLLARLLDALAGQTGPSTFDVIVADNSPSGAIGQWIMRERPPSPFPIRHVHAAEVVGPSHARNRGAASARSAYLGFLDDDTEPAPSWVETVVRYFRAYPAIGILAGRMLPCRLEHPLEHSRQLLYDRRDRRYGCRETTEAIARRFGFDVPTDYYLADYFTGANAACRREVFERLGGFDRAILHGQDHDLAIRALQAGWQVAYAPDLVVRHEHGRSYRKFASQSYQHGISTTDRVVQLERTRGFAGELVHQLSVAGRAVGEYAQGWRPGVSARERANLGLTAVARLLHTTGVAAWGVSRGVRRLKEGPAAWSG